MRRLHVPSRLRAYVALAAAAGVPAPATGHAGFGDIGADAFHTEAVQWMVDNEITTGTAPGCFSPTDTVTRGQAGAFTWRMEGCSPAVRRGGPHPLRQARLDRRLHRLGGAGLSQPW